MTAGAVPAAGGTVEVATTTMATDGRAVGRLPSGKVLFVTGALPGETVLASVEDERASHASGRVVDLVRASPERVAPPCPRVADGCGGCQWQHVDPAAQRRLKAQIVDEALRRFGRINPPPPSPTVTLDPWRYRTSLRVGVTGGRAGLRRLHSHDLVDAEPCLVVHPLLQELLGGERYHGADQVVLRCGARTGERLAAPIPTTAPLDLPADVRRDAFHERAGGREWQVSAASFFQSRPDGADALADLVGAAVGLAPTARPGTPAAGRALDLYSGVGLFAGVLADRGWTVTAVEGSASSTADARTNLADLPVRVVQADVNRWTPAPADVVVADPSRAGLGKGGVAVVAGSGARRLVLVSCDAPSLGRDAGLLAAAGYQLRSVTPVDLFPQTFRVEVVSVFDRP